MKHLFSAALIALAGMAQADMVEKPANGSVTEVMDRLEAAVTGAGATVFARVNHGAGAKAVEMDLADAELLIFGNPRLGTPVMQMDMLAGLALPLKVLVYEGPDGTMIAYEDVPDMLDGLSVDLGAEVLGRIGGALDGLTNAAVGE